MQWTVKLENDGRTVDAWAWSLYRLDLAMRGCFEISRPDFAYIGLAADSEEKLAHEARSKAGKCGTRHRERDHRPLGSASHCTARLRGLTFHR